MDLIKGKGQLIDGRWQIANTEMLHSLNPATCETVWEGSIASQEQIALAYQAAKEALGPWSRLSFETRSQYCQRFAELVTQNKQKLATLISLETGKPLWESETEAAAVIGKIKLSIQAYQDRTGDRRFDTPEAQAHLGFKPHGVVAVLGAYNFPAHLSNGHIVPALLAGNTLLYKPSEFAPATAELILSLWQEAGLPAGVINGLQGGVSVGKAILDQPLKGVFFTGSYVTGLKIHQQFSLRPEVILALEMGGNNPLVLGKTANLSAAVYHSLLSAYITAGQRCTCARRLIIPDNQMGESFLQQFIQAAKNITIDVYDANPQPFMGTVISHQQALKHLQGQQALLDAGGEAILPMQIFREGTGFLSAGIVEMTAVSNPIDEEIFAPLVQIYRYQDFDQAIALANQTRYGLAAGLLSDEPEQYQQFYQQVNAGLINLNRPTTGAASALPFGGIGYSGNHRPSAYFAADYCAYPIASLEKDQLELPEKQLPGLKVN